MIYEFLYRGPIAAENRPSAWHVIVSQDVEVFGEPRTQTKGPLTPDQSAAAGFPLSDIFAEINTTVMAERDAEVAAHEATKAKAQELAATLDKVVQVAGDALERAATHEATVADLQAQLDALKAEADADTPDDLVQPANPVLNKLTFGLLGK